MSDAVWGWVDATRRELTEAGHDRLAEAMDELPRRIGRPEEFDAAYPEAIAAARALNLPWVEVFLRHWRLQSLVIKRQHGAKALPDVVELLEFAHREETKDCPQSVCAVQDFTVCHAIVDGPGYVPERLAVLDETLAVLEPSRGCFDCLNREYSSALEDDGRLEDALAHLVAAEGKRRAAGGRPSLDTGTRRARLIGQLGRPREGLELLARLESEHRDEFGLDEEDVRDIALLRADLYTRLGDAEAASAHLWDIELLADNPADRLYWAEIAERLIALGGHGNTAELGAAISSWAGYLETTGANRACFGMLLIGGRLAVARGARTVACVLGELAAAAFETLRKRDDATAAALAELREAAEALPSPEAPVPPAELPAYIHAQNLVEADVVFQPDGPETHLDLLAEAHRLEPGDADVLAAYAQYLTFLGLPGVAADLLWARVEADPGHREQSMLLGSVLLHKADADGLARLAALVAPVDQAQAHWYRANLAVAQGQWADCVRECEAIVALDDSALNTRRMWAAAAVELGDFETAQRVWTELLDRADPGEDADEARRAQSSDHWGLIVAATANGDWAAVRERCAFLGIGLDTAEGPIDERWHHVELRHQGPEGRFAVYAVRTGPATAVVEAVTGPESPFNYGDLVVVDPTPLEEPPEDPERQETWHPSYAVVTVLQPGGYLPYVIDGVDPGERFGAFSEALRERGFGLWIYSGEEYQLTPPGASEPVLGVFAGIAVPPGVSAAEAAALLTELTAGWPHPLAWLDLAEAAGEDPAPHLKIIADYGL